MNSRKEHLDKIAATLAAGLFPVVSSGLLASPEEWAIKMFMSVRGILEDEYNIKSLHDLQKEKENEERLSSVYPLNKVPIPKDWEQYGFREPSFNEYFLIETGEIGYQDGGVSFAGREAEHIIVRLIGKK